MWAEMPLAYVADARKGITPPALDVRDVIISTQDTAKIRKEPQGAIKKGLKVCLQSRNSIAYGYASDGDCLSEYRQVLWVDEGKNPSPNRQTANESR